MDMLGNTIIEQIKPGRTWDLILLVLTFAATFYFLDRVAKGKPLPRIRRIAALEAIAEGVGRSVEIRKPVHFSFGAYGADVYGDSVSQTLASLGVLSHTAGLSAKLGARFIFHLPQNPEAIPIIEGTILEAFTREGKPEAFNKSQDMRFYGTGTMIHTTGMSQSFMSEGVGLKIMVGRQYTTVYPALENAKLQGAIVIGGTARWTAQYIFALTCDYMFIGEELFAGGAVVTGNPFMISSLAAEELDKVFSIAFVFLGLILSLLLGVTGFTNIAKL